MNIYEPVDNQIFMQVFHVTRSCTNCSSVGARAEGAGVLDAIFEDRRASEQRLEVRISREGITCT